MDSATADRCPGMQSGTLGFRLLDQLAGANAAASACQFAVATALAWLAAP